MCMMREFAHFHLRLTAADLSVSNSFDNSNFFNDPFLLILSLAQLHAQVLIGVGIYIGA